MGEDDPVQELAVTVIGHDRPGIIADVTEILAGLGLNLTDSTMTRLRWRPPSGRSPPTGPLS